MCLRQCNLPCEFHIASLLRRGIQANDYFCSWGASVPPLCVGSVSVVPAPVGVLDAPGAGCSDGVAAGPVAGFGGGEVNTTEPPRCWVEKIARASDVTIKMH